MNSFDDDDDEEPEAWDQETVALFETTPAAEEKKSRWSRTSSAPNIRTVYKKKPTVPSHPSGLRYSIATGAIRRSVDLGPFEDVKNTFWPDTCEIFVYRDGDVMINAQYTDIPLNHPLAYLDGISTKADIETILVTSETDRKIKGFTPPTRLDHLSVEEIARTVSHGNLGVMSMASLSSRLVISSSANETATTKHHHKKGGGAIEENADIIWGKVMPNSMPSGITLRTERGSVVHISASSQNAFIFPKARVDHRIRLMLGDGKGPIQLSYFTGGLEISPEAVVTLKKKSTRSSFTSSSHSPGNTYTGGLALFLRTQNNTATEFADATIRLSMSRLGFRRMRRRGGPQKSMMFESQALRSRGGGGGDNQTALGPIEVFEYRGVKIPMGSNYTRVPIHSNLKLDWTLQYDISNTFATRPNIYGGIQSKDTNIPPSDLTFILKGMRVGLAQLRTSLPKNEIRYVYLGQDSMIEIQNLSSSETMAHSDILIITSRLTVVNRKKTKVSLTLYRNLSAEETVLTDENSFKIVADPPLKGIDSDDVISVDDIPIGSPRFVTKASDTTHIWEIHLYDIPGNGGIVKATIVVTRPYKPQKNMQKMYLYQKKLASKQHKASGKSQKKNSRFHKS